MDLTHFDYYLIAINIIGFILFAINTWLYTYTPDKQIDAVFTIVSLLGGAGGIIISILIFDRKAAKGNMMSRVFVICVFVVELIVFLILKGHVNSEISFKFWEFFGQHRWLAVYLIIINVITLIAFGIDKIAAIEHRSRIRIVTLLFLAFAGGSVGALIGMYAFRHKTKKDYFSVGVPLIIIMQIVVR